MLIFIGGFALSMLISAVVFHFTLQGAIREAIQEGIERRVVQIENMAETEEIPVARAVQYLSASDIVVESFGDLQSANVELAPEELQRLTAGEMVFVDRRKGSLLIQGIVLLHDRYVVLSPNITRETYGFINVMQRTMTLVPLTLGTLLILIVAYTVIRPINEISSAARQVANGDFTVGVREEGYDEITKLAGNFNRMVKELQANEYLHKDFVSNVSHEFKTPVTSLRGYVKLLKDKDLPEEKRQEFYDIIISESDRLANLSANLLKMAELENRSIGTRRETFSLAEQIRDVIILLQNEWEKKEIEFSLELADAEIIGEKDLLYQVWLNLIANAVTYSPAKGVIEVEYKAQGSHVSVRIQDQGPGMTQAEMKRIFERFYQADRSRNRTGAGLGLSIAKKL